jgi:formylglycine-generating enzyme required for sulfatase activity
VAAGALLLGLLAGWAAVLRVRTADGIIELLSLPEDAQVFVDGGKVAVIWPGGAEPAIVTVPAGKRKVIVKKDGLQTSGENVTIQAGEKIKFTVRFVPLAGLGPGTDDRVGNKVLGTIDSTIGMKFVLIPAGEFLMGSPDGEGESREHPQHRVRISRSFYLGVHEVTQEQYRAVMGYNPSRFSSNGGGMNALSGRQTDNHPVENVSWLEAVAFCNRLSQKEGLKPFYVIDGKMPVVTDWAGPGYRLPTQAEWEYACRGRSKTRYSYGDESARLGEYAWYLGNAGDRTHPVGVKAPNGFGLFDMHGNVWEWCWDWSGEGYDARSPQENPSGPEVGTSRVTRGGSWMAGGGPNSCRSASCAGGAPDYRVPDLGFRVARIQFKRT